MHVSWGGVIINSLGFLITGYLITLTRKSYVHSATLFLSILVATGGLIWLCGLDSRACGECKDKDEAAYIGMSGVLLALCSYLLLAPCLLKPFAWGRWCGAVAVSAIYVGCIVGVLINTPELDWLPCVCGVVVGGISAVIVYKAVPACGRRCCSCCGNGDDDADGLGSMRRPLNGGGRGWGGRGSRGRL